MVGEVDGVKIMWEGEDCVEWWLGGNGREVGKSVVTMVGRDGWL